MTFDNPSISSDPSTQEAQQVSALSAGLVLAHGWVYDLTAEVAELSAQVAEANALLTKALTALAGFECSDKGAIGPCDTCWPCMARQALAPIPLH